MRRFPDGDPVDAEGSTRSIPARTCEIVMMDAFGLSDAIASRDVSCSEVMTAYLDHIERLNPLVNAIVSLEDRGNLLSQAAKRDAEAARGAPLGWMHGFPVAIKDLARTKVARRRRCPVQRPEYVWRAGLKPRKIANRRSQRSTESRNFIRPAP